MIAYVLYNKETEGERTASDLFERLEAERVEAELLDADSARGIEFIEHYAIYGRPAVALIKDDGVPVQIWEGADSLPVPADVAYMAHQ